MKRRWMVGTLAVAIAVGGALGVSTMGIGFAMDNPDSNLKRENGYRHSVEQQAPSSIRAAEQTSGQKPLLTVEQAIAAALTQAEGYVESIELERDKGSVYYEVEVESSSKEYDIYVDAYSGEILKVKEERDRNAYKSERMKDVLTMVEAVAIATEKVQGIVTKAELDSDDGQLYYEIEIRSGREEVEVEIDARTGEILSVEYDD